MDVQVRTNNSTVPFIRAGEPVSKDNETLEQISGRTSGLVFGTLLAQKAANQKWVPLTDVTATDGSATARGVYLGGDVAAATIAAGDVVGAPVLVGGNVIIDNEQLVIENSLTLNTAVGGSTTEVRRIEDDLANRGIFVESTVDIDEFENT